MKKAIFDKFLDPIVITLACLITFLPQIPSLGFVIDDWAYIDFYSFRGLDGLISYTFMIDSRPFAFWIPWIGFKLFGTSPLPWQLWTLFWNIAAALVVWLALKQLFPRHRQQNLLAALIFALYPLYFTHQYSALQLSVHAVCYFLLGLSFYLTICALRRPKHWLAFTAGAVLLSFAQILTTEYFAGLELARLLVIFFLVAQSEPVRRKQLLQTAKQWLPYLLVWVFWAAWRVALMPRPAADRNAPVMVAGLFTNPLKTLLDLLQMAVQDIVQMLGGVWTRTYNYTNFSFTPLSNLAAWGAALAVVGLLFFALRRMSAGAEEKPYPWQAALAGFAALVLGFLPGWAIGQPMAYTTVLSDRFGMGAIPGAALLLAAGAGLLLRSRRVQNGALLLLIGLAVGFQFRSLAPYRYSWEQQQDLYWQLKWRAPSIDAPTAFLGNGQLINNLGDWFLTPALDHLYAEQRPTINPLYYYLDVTDNMDSNLTNDGTTLLKTKYKRVYKSQADDSLVMQYNYGTGRCLWLLNEADRGNPYLAEELEKYLPLSNLQRIHDGPDAPADTQAFGSSYPINWCYYFQKARLAEQNGQWSKVVELWGQAAQKGLAPKSPAELIPFVRGAAFAGNWSLALSLTERANNPSSQMEAYLCQTWQEIGQKSPGQPAVEQAKKSLGCK